MTASRIALILIAPVLLFAAAAHAGTIYVNGAAQAGDGSSWASPLNDVGQALKLAKDGDAVWVAAGVYTPGRERTATFRLVEGVSLYGGFAGNETELARRDPEANQTVLSGDIGITGVSDDNVFHVVTGADRAVLDGFTISGGYSLNARWHGAKTVTPEDAAKAPGNGQGAGMLNFRAAPTVRNCVFQDNHALEGGAVYNMTSADPAAVPDHAPRFMNCDFWQNSALAWGGGVANVLRARPLFVSCQFDSNLSEYKGGGMYNGLGAGPVLFNCLFRNNEAPHGGGLALEGDGSATLYYCTLTGNRGLKDGPAIHLRGGRNLAVLLKTVVWDNEAPTGDMRFLAEPPSVVRVQASIIQNGYDGKDVFQANPSLDRRSETSLNSGYKTNAYKFAETQLPDRYADMAKYGLTAQLPALDPAHSVAAPESLLATRTEPARTAEPLAQPVATSAPTPEAVIAAIPEPPASEPSPPAPTPLEATPEPEPETAPEPAPAPAPAPPPAPAPEPDPAPAAKAETAVESAPAPTPVATPKPSAVQVTTVPEAAPVVAAPVVTAAAVPETKQDVTAPKTKHISEAPPAKSAAKPQIKTQQATPPVEAESLAVAAPRAATAATVPVLPANTDASKPGTIQARDSLAAQDMDGNGCLTINETSGLVRQQFWRVDHNGDGCVSRAELKRFEAKQDETAATAQPVMQAAAVPSASRQAASPASPAAAPSAFPAASVSSTTVSGYTLFAPVGGTKTYLMDGTGKTVKTWEGRDRVTGTAHLLQNGNLLRTVSPGKGEVKTPFEGKGVNGGIIQEVSPRGQIVWEYSYVSKDVRQHHDIAPLPNGNVLVLAWELKKGSELDAAGASVRNHPDGQIWAEHIVEVRKSGPRSGQIVWAWHAWDHLVQNTRSDAPDYANPVRLPQRMDVNYNPGRSPDWLHADAMDYNPVLDQIVLSLRNTGEIWIIDHSTSTEEAASSSGGLMHRGGDILFRWGNPAAYGAAGKAELKDLRDARWIDHGKPGTETILVFNGKGPSTGRPAVLEVKPQYYLKATTLAAQVVWSYETRNGTVLSAGAGSCARRLPDGNTLVCDGPGGRILEVTPQGELVWEQASPASPLYRAERIQQGYPGLARLTLP